MRYSLQGSEKLVDRLIILNHEVFFPRAARGFGGTVSPDTPNATDRSDGNPNVSMDQSHLTPPQRPTEAKLVAICICTAGGCATIQFSSSTL